jgi:alkanesulfonate monooxygenase SsuD/methylene tetrahydromethanopterin reductase-like flavin-dependent oxidoreductase (luciferase family)
MGVGIGWNRVEYEALGEDFATRGRRLDEQAEVLRRLWTQRSVTYLGQHHRITGAGLAPMPVQRPIPLWFGGSSAPAYRRMGRLADGWFPQVEPGAELEEARAVIAHAARDAGRDPATIGMESRLSWRGDPEALAARAAIWRDAGATHLSINTMGAGLSTVDDHLAALGRAAAALSVSPA